MRVGQGMLRTSPIETAVPCGFKERITRITRIKDTDYTEGGLQDIALDAICQ